MTLIACRTCVIVLRSSARRLESAKKKKMAPVLQASVTCVALLEIDT